MRLQVEAYASAREFLDAFDVARPGCLLVDVRMPGIGGLELLDQLNREDVPLPAIVMSAYGDVPMVVRAMKAGRGTSWKNPAATRTFGTPSRRPSNGTKSIASA